MMIRYYCIIFCFIYSKFCHIILPYFALKNFQNKRIK